MYYRIINRKKKVATIIADLLGYAIWSPVRLFGKKPVHPEDIREILVVRTAYIGDVVMTMPILKPLKGLYPRARITFLTSSGAGELFKNNPFVDEVLTYDAFWFYPDKDGNAFGNYLNFLRTLRRRRYDLVIEARADIRDILLICYLSKARSRVSYKVGGGGFLLTHIVPFGGIKHRVDYHLDIMKYLGASTDGIEWGLSTSKKEDAEVDELLRKGKIVSPDLFVGIHPGGRKDLKSWDLNRFAELADRLVTEYGATVVFTGSDNEVRLIDEIIEKMSRKAISLAGRTNLRGMISLMKRLDLFICNDTSPLHIASAMKTHTVAIFGPSKSNETGPYRNICRVVEKDLPCRYTCDEDVCNHHVYRECMDRIGVEDVIDAVRKVIDESGVMNKSVRKNDRNDFSKSVRKS